MKNWTAFLIALVIAAILAFSFVRPPAPVGVDYDLSDFSSGRAMQDVRIIAAEPHPTGTAENAKVREYLKDRLSQLGLTVEEHKSQISGRPLKRLNRWSGQNKTSQDIFNITGILPGSDRTQPALLLMAHHDTVWDSPGASDDTIGMAVTLEILRAIKDEPRERDLIVLFTDAEELGLAGAVHFFDHNPLKDRIGAIINFEARGGGGTANLFQLSAGNGAAAKLFGRSVREPSASSLAAYIYSILPNDTDLTPALKKDYIAYNIAIIERAGLYHSPLIDADALDERSVQHMGVQGIDLTRALLSAEMLPTKTSDATFFDLFGFAFIAYAPFWGWNFLIIGLLGYILSVRGNIDRKAIGQGAARMLGFILLGGMVLFVLNGLSKNAGLYEGLNRGVSYYDRLAAIPKLEIVAALACLAGFLYLFSKQEFNANQRFGAALPIIILGFAGQAYAPTATYIISVPVLLTGIGAFAVSRWPGLLGKAVAIITGALIAGYMLGLGHMILQGVGPDMLSVAILPAALGIMALLNLYPGLDSKTGKIAGGVSLALALCFALWIRFDALAVTVPTYQVW